MNYSNPENNVYLIEKRKIRNTQGCETCIYSKGKAWDRVLCINGYTPNKRGFCRHWRYNKRGE